LERPRCSAYFMQSPDFAEVFTVHLLTRNSRVDADLADHLFNSSEKRLARPSAAGEFRQGGKARAHHRENQPGDARGDDWDYAPPRQLLHEQIQEARLHRIQWQAADPQLVIERRSARLGSLGKRRRYSGNVVNFEQQALLELAIV
jgi:hypothetical protein